MYEGLTHELSQDFSPGAEVMQRSRVVSGEKEDHSADSTRELPLSSE